MLSEAEIWLIERDFTLGLLIEDYAQQAGAVKVLKSCPQRK